jgi:actin-related protein 6
MGTHALRGAGGEARLVLDNGASTLKLGVAGEPSPRVEAPNCVAKHRGGRFQAAGPEISELADIGGLAPRRAFERGFLTNVELERDVLSAALDRLPASARECELMCSEPLLNPPSLMALLDELVFEELGFLSACFGHPASLSLLDPTPSAPSSLPSLPAPQRSAMHAITGLVLDAGFSFCHAVPVFEGRAFLPGVRRLDLGGKALTNHLKEQISFRHVNIMDEFFLAEEALQQVCFVSQRVDRSLSLSRRPRRSPLRRDWVLPDGMNLLRGTCSAHVGELPSSLQQQTCSLTNERFLTPEVLFSPPDIGLNQRGLPQTALDAVSACPPFLQRPLLANVVLSGGLAALPGLEMRFARELRSLTPDTSILNVSTAEEPALAAWRGASVFASSPQFNAHKLTKHEYSETGGRQQMYERLAESADCERAGGRVT